MKRITIILLLLSFVIGVGYGQSPIKRKKSEKTEQGQSGSSSSSQHNTQNNRKKETKPIVKVSEPDGYINGHGYVDLGLPSGLKWATCNVGATSPFESGEYFTWGSISPRTKAAGIDGFGVSESAKKIYDLGVVDDSWNLMPKYDAASMLMHTPWRIPTEKECEELMKFCTKVWCNSNGLWGYRITGPNNNSIFLPAAGYFHDSSGLLNHNNSGYYQSSTHTEGMFKIYGISFGKDFFVVRDNYTTASSIRPVCR